MRLTTGRLSALRLLAEGWDDAEGDYIAVRQFAIGLSGLYRAGANEADLRWLIARRLAEPLVEITRNQSQLREFHEHRGLNFDERTCFVLTYAGRLLVEAHGLNHTDEPRSNTSHHMAAARVKWDAECHELWVDGRMAKRYAQPAPCQWAILDAFEGANWPRRVIVMLPTNDRRDRSRRLSEVVADLNRGLKGSPIHFLLDGSGRGVVCDLQ
ncbi:MAG TPA: hypothetical protein VGN42_14170 [Pirellulales bacterium]|nr:hypothetical protein [Pirellulales bacterium]